MKTIAFWSRSHKAAARAIIAVCHLLILWLAWYVGNGLKENYVAVSSLVFPVCLAVFLLTNILFTGHYASFTFYKKKVLSGVILLCGFLMVVSVANQPNVTALIYTSIHGSFGEKRPEESKPGSKPSFKELRKQFRDLKKMMKEERASAGGIITAIIVGVLLSGLIASASCSLSCDGQDALAAVVLLGGLTAVFFICRMIIRKTKKKVKAPQPTAA